MSIIQRLSVWITQHSVVKRQQYPCRKNTLFSLLIIVVSLPLSVLVYPVLWARAQIKGQLRVTVISIDNEFAHFVQFMELLRGGIKIDGSSIQTELSSDVVFVLGRYKHLGFKALYSEVLNRKIFWATRASRLWLQAVILLPDHVVHTRRLSKKDFPVGIRRFSSVPIRATSNLVDKRPLIIRNHRINPEKYVLIAVFTKTYELERNPEYSDKTAVLESSGQELTGAIDYLRGCDIEVIRVGSPDVGKARIPRDILRLESFSKLGGSHEVQLAKGCKYFWTDGVGAFWLSVPFRRPILFTNQTHLAFKKWQAIPHPHLFVPVRYVNSAGHELTMDEMLSATSKLHKAVVRGELSMVRTSHEEMREANAEFNARLDGVWTDTDDMVMLQSQMRRLFDEHNCLPISISSTFLIRNRHLLQR